MGMTCQRDVPSFPMMAACRRGLERIVCGVVDDEHGGTECAVPSLLLGTTTTTGPEKSDASLPHVDGQPVDGLHMVSSGHRAWNVKESVIPILREGGHGVVIGSTHDQ